ncbi:integrase [Escherichia coli]|nr:integrase [Escherichia coli]
MSKVFICAAIPDELATREEGAVAVATAIEAGDERRARAKFHWQFLEHYPAAQDCAYKFIVCEDKPGIPRPALDSWDAEYMQENRWDEESASFVPVETESDPMNVTFDKLAPEVQNAVMVKFDTCENITVDMVISAQELLQEDMATWFVYKDVRVRENLGVPDTAKNRRVAGELRSSVCYAIKTGVFDYAKQFPSSRNLEKFGEARQDLTIKELAEKFLALKETEVAKTSLNTYRAVIKNILSIIGEKNLALSINKEKLLEVRKELLTGYQIPKSNYIVTQPGRSAVTVNNYMTNLNAVFQFGVDNGYLADNPFKGISPLKESRTIPDPLSREEFIRLIDACRNQQAKNLWCVSVYTGVRPSELCALGWEDIDLKNGTMMIRRNLAKDRFTVPKTQAGTNRVIHLIKPAIDALRSQMTLTRLSKEHIIDVHLREYGRTEKQKCTFVFQPEVSARVKNYGDHFTVDSIRQMWDAAIKRAGLRHRKSYQSRHTYACWSLTAGANPAFIANQMGHADAQMVFQVYGKWMSENNNAQVALLNTQLSEFAPTMPHNEAMKN